MKTTQIPPYPWQVGIVRSLQWRHNEHDSVSNHQPRDCLLNRLFGRRSKKTSKLRVTGLCAGNSPDSPHKGPVTRKMFPFDNVIMFREQFKQVPTTRIMPWTHLRSLKMAWWRHQMETFFALLALWTGNSSVTGEFALKDQWRGALMFSLICALNKRLSKQSWGWWLGTPSRSLWCHCNGKKVAVL